MRKKTIYVLFINILLASLLLTSCGDGDKKSVEKNNLDEFHREFGLTNYVIPENFIEQVDYSEGYYFHEYDENEMICWEPLPRLKCEGYEVILLYFQYDDRCYDEAKQYVFETLEISDTPAEECNGYYFYDYSAPSEYVSGYFFINGFYEWSDYEYPYYFYRLACNDNNNTLIFLGLNYYDNEHPIEELTWEEILDTFFVDMYSFEK